MSIPEPQPTPPPPTSPFQFSLRTLLLLFVVLGSSLAVFGAWGIVVFGLVVGLATYLNQVESLPSLMQFLLLLVCLLGFLALLMSGVSTARESTRRVQCANNLKQIAQALHFYHQANGCFPPAYIADKSGKPMHSWRVLILPYLDRNDLYEAYDFTQPWDGPKNKGLSAVRPRVYACPADPSDSAAGATQTSYVAVVGANAAWPGIKSRTLGPVDFPGGAGNTIMLVEVAESGIAWTEPRDLSLESLGMSEADLPALTLSSRHSLREDFFYIYDQARSAYVVTVDDVVRYLPPGSVTTEGLRKMLRVDGFGEDEQEGTASRADAYDEKRRLNWPNIAALAVWLLSVGTLLTQAVRSRKST